MLLQFIKSQLGNDDFLVHVRFIHNKDREGKGKVIWRYNEIKNCLNCLGRVHTMQGKLFLYDFFFFFCLLLQLHYIAL